jgi:lipopolysaccharide transport system permease protein
LAAETVVTRAAVVIEPNAGYGRRKLHDLWVYRELLWFLIWRDTKVRYKHTALGASWALLQPLATTIVLTVSFGRLARVPSEGLPYSLFALGGLVPWTYFASALTGASLSVVGNQQLIGKVYFPRLLVPLASVLTPLMDAAIGLGLLIAAMLWFGVAPGASILWLPAFLLLALGSAAGAGIWLAALGVKYRDTRFIVPFAVQLLMFASPVAYPTSVLSPPWRLLFSLNPMTGVIDGFRWSLVGGPAPGPMMLVSCATVFLLLAGGIRYFYIVEGTFADRL